MRVTYNLIAAALVAASVPAGATVPAGFDPDDVHDGPAHAPIAVGKADCDDGTCTSKASYTSFGQQSLTGKLIAGPKTQWFIPSELEINARDSMALLRLGEAQYAYLAETLQTEPKGSGPLTIALIPCPANCGGVVGSGTRGTKGIELYYGDRTKLPGSDILPGSERVRSLIRAATGGADEVLQHEMSHNFDNASKQFGVDGTHFFTAVISFQAFKTRYDGRRHASMPATHNTSALQADQLLEDYAARYLAEESSLASCIAAPPCGNPEAPAYLTAVVMRLNDVQVDFGSKFMIEAAYLTPNVVNFDRFVRVASRAAGGDLSCVADQLGWSISATARSAAAATGTAPAALCAAFANDNRPLLKIPTVLDGALPTNTKISVPNKIEVTFPPEQKGRAQVTVPLDPKRATYYRVCSADDAKSPIIAAPDTVLLPPELTTFISFAPKGCADVGELVGHSGQTDAVVDVLGSGRGTVEFWYGDRNFEFSSAGVLSSGPSGPLLRYDLGYETPSKVATAVGAFDLSTQQGEALLTTSDATRLELVSQRSAVRSTIALEVEPPADDALAGVWFDPERPGFGLQLAEEGDNGELVLAGFYSYAYRDPLYAPSSRQTWLVGVGTAATQSGGITRIPVSMPGEGNRSAPWGELRVTRDGVGLLVEYAGRFGYSGHSRMQRLFASVPSPFAGAWLDPNRPGSGWNITADEQGALVVAEYTYEPGPTPFGMPTKARWRVGAGAVDAGRATVDLTVGQGGSFADWQPKTGTTIVPAGRVEITTDGCDRLSLTESGVGKKLVRVLPSGLCTPGATGN